MYLWYHVWLVFPKRGCYFCGCHRDSTWWYKKWGASPYSLHICLLLYSSHSGSTWIMVFRLGSPRMVAGLQDCQHPEPWKGGSNFIVGMIKSKFHSVIQSVLCTTRVVKQISSVLWLKLRGLRWYKKMSSEGHLEIRSYVVFSHSITANRCSGIRDKKELCPLLWERGEVRKVNSQLIKMNQNPKSCLGLKGRLLKWFIRLFWRLATLICITCSEWCLAHSWEQCVIIYGKYWNIS